jgi:hypothetical protein
VQSHTGPSGREGSAVRGRNEIYNAESGRLHTRTHVISALQGLEHRLCQRDPPPGLVLTKLRAGGRATKWDVFGSSNVTKIGILETNKTLSTRKLRKTKNSVTRK